MYFPVTIDIVVWLMLQVVAKMRLKVCHVGLSQLLQKIAPPSINTATGHWSHQCYVRPAPPTENLLFPILSPFWECYFLVAVVIGLSFSRIGIFDKLGQNSDVRSHLWLPGMTFEFAWQWEIIFQEVESCIYDYRAFNSDSSANIFCKTSKCPVQPRQMQEKLVCFPARTKGNK